MTNPTPQTLHPVVQINTWADDYEKEGGHALIVQMLRAYAALAAQPPAVAAIPETYTRLHSGDIRSDVFAERLACAKLCDDFAHKEGPGERRYSGNVLSARIMGRSGDPANLSPVLPPEHAVNSFQRPQPPAGQQDRGEAPDAAYSYAAQLATSLFKKHFAGDEDYVSGRVVWGLSDTTVGVLTQIDNMVSGLSCAPVTAGEATAAQGAETLQILEQLVEALASQDEEGLIEHAEPMIAARRLIAALKVQAMKAGPGDMKIYGAIADRFFAAIAQKSPSTDFPECSGDPSSCPENEGRGCCGMRAPSRPLVEVQEPTLDELKTICAETYQVVGSLASDLGIFESSDRLVKVLDNLSQQKRVHTDVLPWPSFAAPVRGLPLTRERKLQLFVDATGNHWTHFDSFVSGVESAEAAHGIGASSPSGSGEEGK